MEFIEKELKVILQSLNKARSESSGATQSERHKLDAIQKIIDKIEGEIGPVKARRTAFDRKMDKSLSVLKKKKS